jgi:hypothetical protein
VAGSTDGTAQTVCFPLQYVMPFAFASSGSRQEQLALQEDGTIVVVVVVTIDVEKQ